MLWWRYFMCSTSQGGREEYCLLEYFAKPTLQLDICHGAFSYFTMKCVYLFSDIYFCVFLDFHVWLHLFLVFFKLQVTRWLRIRRPQTRITEHPRPMEVGWMGRMAKWVGRGSINPTPCIRFVRNWPADSSWQSISDICRRMQIEACRCRVEWTSSFP
jgi:hypothetical protein